MAKFTKSPSAFAKWEQKIFHDETVKKSMIYYSDPFQKGNDVKFNRTTLEYSLIENVPSKQMILEVPLELRLDTNNAPNAFNGPYTYNTRRAFHAEYGLLDWIYKFEVSMNGQPLHLNEESRLSLLKLNLSNYKFSEDDAKLIAQFGLPFSVTQNDIVTQQVSFNSSYANSQYRENPIMIREHYEDLLANVRSTQEFQSFEYQNRWVDQTFHVNTRILRQCIPLHMLFPFFRSDAILPAGTQFTIELWAHKKPRVISVDSVLPNNEFGEPTASWYTVRAVIDTKSPRLVCGTKILEKAFAESLNEWRVKNDAINFYTDIIEDSIVQTTNGKEFDASIVIQRNLPMQIFARFVANETLIPNKIDGMAYFEPTNDKDYFYVRSIVSFVFADSCCHIDVAIPSEPTYLLNNIKQLRFTIGGQKYIEYDDRDDNSFGGAFVSADGYIFKTMSKNSFTSLVPLGTMPAFEKYLGERAKNGTYSFMLGEFDVATTSADMDMKNIRMQLNLYEELPSYITLRVARKLPAIIELGVAGEVAIVRWPEIKEGQKITVLYPAPGS